MRQLTGLAVKHQIEDMELLKLAHKRNHCADNQIVTSYSINCGGRTLLIGVDYNPDKLDEASLHTVGCDGVTMYSEGWSVRNGNKADLIKSAMEQLELVLNSLIPD